MSEQATPRRFAILACARRPAQAENSVYSDYLRRVHSVTVWPFFGLESEVKQVTAIGEQ